MELVDGPNLSEVMESLVRLAPADAAAILAPIAAALDYSCRQGVIHRDVKPSNVLLAQADDDTPNVIHIRGGLDVPVLPLLSDFGIARSTHPISPAPDARLAHPPTCLPNSAQTAMRSMAAPTSIRWGRSSIAVS